MSENDLGHYVDVVLHELTSPLSSLQMWASVLRSSTEDRVLHAKAIDAIERSTHLQMGLVQDLRDLSRVMRNEISRSTRAVSLSSVIEAAIAGIHTHAGEHHCEIDARVAPGIEITGDEDKLVRTFQRSFEQTLAACRRGGRLLIEAIVEDDVVCTITRMPADESNMKPTFALLFVRTMVEFHGGKLLLRDDGATLVLRFPR